MATYTIQNNSERRVLEDSEALTQFPPQVTLSVNKQTVNADGVDFVTINVQLKSVPLSDDRQVNLKLAQSVILTIGDVEIRLDTDENGHATHELDFTDAGVYVVGVQYLNGNSLTITAV